MVGDNPTTDIRGANDAGSHWRSVLLRTGIFDGPDNDFENPADFVVPGVLDAVRMIIEMQSHISEMN